MSKSTRVDPKVALAIGVALAVVQGVLVYLNLSPALHVALATVVTVAAVYGYTAASPAVLAKVLPPRLLAAVGAILAGLSAAIVLIPVGSAWRTIILAVVAIGGTLIPAETRIP